MSLPEHDPAIPRTMKDEISTSNHHYIPRFYLRGFTNDEGLLYLYDKRTGHIKVTGPGGAFFEIHGNTGFLQRKETGEKHWTDMAEHLLAGLDTSLAGCLAIIRDTNAKMNVMGSPVVIAVVKQLIHFLYWRTPSNKAKLDRLLATVPFKDLGFGIFSKNRKRQREAEQLLATIDVWRKCAPALIATARHLSNYRQDNNADWGIYYGEENHYLVTDNPVLLTSYTGPESLEKDLLFPLAGNMLAISRPGSKKHGVDLEYREKLDIVLFQQAERYVASSKKGYLLHILENVAEYSRNGNGWEEQLKAEVLGAFLTQE